MANKLILSHGPEANISRLQLQYGELVSTDTGKLYVGNSSNIATPVVSDLIGLTDMNQTRLGLNATSPGLRSVAIGNDSSSVGTGTISIGFNSAGLFDNTIAIGENSTALDINSVALGYSANASAIDSVALGGSATASGGSSVAIGDFASASNDISIALGAFANASNDSSVALGHSATASGGSSVAIGAFANASNDSSVALGRSAKALGGFSIALGAFANASNDSSVALGHSAKALGNYSTALGYNSATSAYETNTIRLGSTNLSALKCAVNLTVTSDERDKIDITNINNSLQFISKLRPIQYVRNPRAEYIPDEETRSEEDQELLNKYGLCSYDKEAHAAGTKKGERKRVGLSAQEIQKALEEVYGTADYANIVSDNFYDIDKQKNPIPEGVENQLTVGYSEFIPFLIGAIKELNAKNSELLERVTNLEAKLS